MLDDEQFIQELMELFQTETAQHLKEMSDGLLALEQGLPAEQTATTLDTIFRHTHSVKGSARTMDKMDIGSICHALEDVLAAWRRDRVPDTPETFDILHQALDAVTRLLAQPAQTTGTQVPSVIMNIRSLLGESESSEPPEEGLEASPKLTVTSAAATEAVWTPLQPHKPTETSMDRQPTPHAATTTVTLPSQIGPRELPRPAANASTATAPQTVRVATDKLDSLLLQTEELVSIKLITQQYTADLREISELSEGWARTWSRVQADARALQHSSQDTTVTNGPVKSSEHLDRLLAFLDWNQNHMHTLQGSLQRLYQNAQEDERALGGLVDGILEDMKRALVQPFSSLLNMLPRMVRDTARAEGKRVALSIEGAELAVDRRILEEMKDAVIHLVRNSIGHGIERPEEREKWGKDPKGALHVSVAQIGSNQVELLIADDGAGIDAVRIRQVAVKQGLIPQAEAEQLTDAAAMQLVFRAGFSTSPIVTDLSGRGLGMAIVREHVEKLGGRIEIESTVHEGTTMRILLPLTLATFRGVLVRAYGQSFVIPTTNVERVLSVPRGTVKTVGGRTVIALDNRPLPLIEMGSALGIARPKGGNDVDDRLTLVVLRSAMDEIAFSVDQVLYEREVLVKGLGSQLLRVNNIAGATILGSGKIVPILNVADLLTSARSGGMRPQPAVADKSQEPSAKAILIAEDSITTRTLLKNILQSAGYNVKTAVDGMDALSVLGSEQIDLLVSDLEMPRLNGFELTGKIRKDARLSDLPVVLVTSLESPEDRERGIEAGANAYIVKRAFDQTNLLEIIRRLL